VHHVGCCLLALPPTPQLPVLQLYVVPLLPACVCAAPAAYGRHAEAVAARLAAGGLSCKVLGRPAFTCAMLEKLVWIRCVVVRRRHGRQCKQRQHCKLAGNARKQARSVVLQPLHNSAPGYGIQGCWPEHCKPAHLAVQQRVVRLVLELHCCSTCTVSDARNCCLPAHAVPSWWWVPSIRSLWVKWSRSTSRRCQS
jgi:hypothetical protein